MSRRLLPPISWTPRATVKRVAVLGALSTTLGMVAPVASASAAAFPGFGAFPPGAGVDAEVVFGPAVHGAVVITMAPSSFINANDQDSVGGNVSGVQIAP
jgi:hypothetical protein